MPKLAFVERVFNRVYGFWGKKSCFSGKLQREKLLLCRGRTCAARSCKVNGHLREGRGPGACRRTTSADSLQANTLVRLFAPQGQTLFAPRFRSTQPWSYAHNPAMPGPYSSARQLQRIHPPAILRRHQPHRRYSGGIGHNRLLPCPAFKIVALAGQRELPECKAAVRL